MNPPEATPDETRRMWARLRARGEELLREGKFEEAEVVLRRALSAAIDRYRGNPTELDETLARLQIALHRLGKEQASEEAESWAKRRKEAFRRGVCSFYGERVSQQRPTPKPRAELIFEQAQQLAIKNEYSREVIWEFFRACNDEGSIERAIFAVRELLKLYELQNHPAHGELKSIWFDLMLPGGFGSLPEPRPDIVVQRKKTKLKRVKEDPERMNMQLAPEWKRAVTDRFQQVWSEYRTAIGDVIFGIQIEPGRKATFKGLLKARSLFGVVDLSDWQSCQTLLERWFREVVEKIQGDPCLELPPEFANETVDMAILVWDEIVYEATYQDTRQA